MPMELRSFLAVATILVSTLLIGLTLLQAKGTGFGAALGGQDYSFRTRRGMERNLHRLTIVVAVVFVAIAAWSAAS